MNVKTNVQAGQDLRFPVMDEASETVKPVDLAKARDYCNRATPAPWTAGIREDESMWMSCGNPHEGRHAQFDWEGFKDDALFAIKARTLLPAALDEIERLRIELALYIRAFRIRANYKPEGK